MILLGVLIQVLSLLLLGGTITFCLLTIPAKGER
jgi:hypothetical protein